jgi:multidrug efflux pump subunit AcrA (membrane-fusion protein)
MKITILRRTFLSLLVLAILNGCQDASDDQPAPLTPDEVAASASDAGDTSIDIEGTVVPTTVVSLSFATPGAVEAVLVDEGESVQAGQALARLGDRQQATSLVAASELELLAAQRDLQALREDHAAVRNQSFLALVGARQDADEAKRLLATLTGEQLEIAITAAEAQLVLAEDDLDAAQDVFADVEDDDETDPVRAGLQLRLAEARRAHDEATRLLDDLQGDGYAFRLAQAQDGLQATEDALALAEARYEELATGPEPGSLALAEARVAAAESALAAAQAGLARYELRAPMAGTVVALDLRPGEQAVVGRPVVQMADLSEWLVETLDLTEIDVVAIDPAQPVRVTADALPEVSMTGTVLSIAAVPRDVRGDVTYVARIKLDAVDPRLRWGMTVLVTFPLSNAADS